MKYLWNFVTISVGLAVVSASAFNQSSSQDFQIRSDEIASQISDALDDGGKVLEVSVELDGCDLKIQYHYDRYCTQNSQSSILWSMQLLDLYDFKLDDTMYFSYPDREFSILSFHYKDKYIDILSKAENLIENSKKYESFLEKNGVGSRIKVRYCSNRAINSSLWSGGFLGLKKGAGQHLASLIAAYGKEHCK